jgi:RNA polymerase sigma-70 factor, ECF subfamily
MTYTSDEGMQVLSDDELVFLAQGGDSTAFSELARRHYRYCVGLACKIMRNSADAEDEVQNSFINAFDHLSELEQKCAFRSWLSKIVVNQCLQSFRKSRSRRFVSADASSRSADRDKRCTREFADQRKTAEQSMMESQTSADALSHARRLPPLLRNVLELSTLQDLPMEVVCDRLQITSAAARSRLVRARVELRRRLTT